MECRQGSHAGAHGRCAWAPTQAARSRRGSVRQPGGLAPWQERYATAALRADLADPPPLARIARDCRLSLSHFARSFTASLGLPPHRWLMMVRIAHAQRLLVETEASLVAIAADCGFADQSHFTRVFTRQVGTSPGAWRRRNCAHRISVPRSFAMPAIALRRRIDPQPAPSRLERMAHDAARVAMPRQAVLGLLLGATHPRPAACAPALRALWADEAMQRAYHMVALTASLEQRLPAWGNDARGIAAECRVAGELAAAWGALDTPDDAAVLPCSEVLRTTVRDLVDLFAPAAGHAQVSTAIERLSLPAVRRRALVLAGSHIVIRALRRAAETGCGAHLTVTLTRLPGGAARLIVGARGGRHRGGISGDIVDDLAEILGGKAIRHTDALGANCVGLRFPA